MSRFLSRKFLLALSTAVTGVLVAVLPEHESEITEIITQISGLALSALSILGYLYVQGQADKEVAIGAARLAETEALAKAKANEQRNE